MLPNGVKGIYDATTWNLLTDKSNNFPVYTAEEYLNSSMLSSTLNFIKLTTDEINNELLIKLSTSQNVVLMLDSNNQHAMADLRNAFFTLTLKQLQTPVFVVSSYDTHNEEEFMLHASTDCGSLLVDGFGDGIMLGDSKIKQYFKFKLRHIYFGYQHLNHSR